LAAAADRGRELLKRIAMGATKTTTLLAALLAIAPLPASAASAQQVGLPAHSPARTVECDDASAGAGVAPASAPGVGPFHMLGAGESGSHWNPATKRFASKVPVVIDGAAPVVVSVPARLGGRLALVYGGRSNRGLSERITSVPCAARPATFFPGGLLFTRREPISVLIQPAGWARPKALRLGVFGPY
jgi:hypothetical protein